MSCDEGRRKVYFWRRTINGERHSSVGVLRCFPSTVLDSPPLTPGKHPNYEVVNRNPHFVESLWILIRKNPSQRQRGSIRVERINKLTMFVSPRFDFDWHLTIFRDHRVREKKPPSDGPGRCESFLLLLLHHTSSLTGGR